MAIELSNPSSLLTDQTVLPGDVVLDLSRMANQTIKLGGGLRQECDSIVVMKAGTLRFDKRNKYWVESSQKRYTPCVGDNVLGIVADCRADNFWVDIKGPGIAFLPVLAFEGGTRRNIPKFEEGTLKGPKLLLWVPLVEREAKNAEPGAEVERAGPQAEAVQTEAGVVPQTEIVPHTEAKIEVMDIEAQAARYVREKEEKKRKRAEELELRRAAKRAKEASGSVEPQEKEPQTVVALEAEVNEPPREVVQPPPEVVQPPPEVIIEDEGSVLKGTSEGHGESGSVGEKRGSRIRLPKGSGTMATAPELYRLKIGTPEQVMAETGVTNIMSPNPHAGHLALAALNQFTTDSPVLEVELNRAAMLGQSLSAQGYMYLNQALFHQSQLTKGWIAKAEELKRRLEAEQSRVLRTEARATRAEAMVADLEAVRVAACKAKTQAEAEKVAAEEAKAKAEAEKVAAEEAKAKAEADATEANNCLAKLRSEVDQLTQAAANKATAEVASKASSQFNFFYLQGWAEAAQWLRAEPSSGVWNIKNAEVPAPDAPVPELKPLPPREELEDEADE